LSDARSIPCGTPGVRDLWADKRRLVERTPHPMHGTLIEIRLTAQGREVFEAADACVAAWAKPHSDITGKILNQREAWQTGVNIFGPLLQPSAK
jgi:hypothetical protein